MKTTYELVNEITSLGFNREKVLSEVDACLDCLFDERKPITEEYLTDDLYEELLETYMEEYDEKRV